jgi:hypothetical protein
VRIRRGGEDEHVSDGPKLVVVTHPRSGSNALVEILRCHPDITLLNEPFNENFSSWLPANPDYLARVADVISLDQVVDGILADYSGFKLHTYQLETDLLAHLLSRDDLCVIFLRRRNLLEAVLSSFIAEQTGLWSAWDRERPLEAYYTDLAPVPLDDLRALLGWTRDSLAGVAAALRTRSDGRSLELFYEDMFLADRTTRWRMVASLWSHLGLTPCQNPRVSGFVDSALFRMGGPTTYGRLPNLAEIEEALGNDETGHISYFTDQAPEVSRGPVPIRARLCDGARPGTQPGGQY